MSALKPIRQNLPNFRLFQIFNQARFLKRLMKPKQPCALFQTRLKYFKTNFSSFQRELGEKPEKILA